jgi:hypothetical protein
LCAGNSADVAGSNLIAVGDCAAWAVGVAPGGASKALGVGGVGVVI